MKIVIAGVWRSGTTALFNMVRLICESDGPTYAVFDDNYDMHKARGAKHQIVKVHKFSKMWFNWMDIVFTTHRDPLDIVESMKRFRETGGNGNAANPDNILRGLEHWGLWQRYTSHMVWFNQWRRSPEKVARELAEKLQIGINEKEIAEQFKKIKPPKSGTDKKTLLHANHITKN